jgi:hypothetical protein
MQVIRKYGLLVLAIAFLGCEDQIFPDLNTNETVIVVDAWVNNMPEPQVITITGTQAYFDNSEPQGLEGAEVKIKDETGKEYIFLPSDKVGEYVWSGDSTNPVFGQSGLMYDLEIKINGTTITSSTRMGRSPVIDSIRFHFVEGTQFLDDSYFAELWAKDFTGPGDTYWIRTWKNGKLLNKPSEISIAFDAGFSAGGIVDGLIYIQPIRDSINPFDQDENDDFLPPYLPGDSVYCEIHSLSIVAHDFLNRVVTQTNRTGGFGELFAQPLANVGTNLKISGNEQILGFFNVAAVTSNQAVLDPNNLPGPRE